MYYSLCECGCKKRSTSKRCQNCVWLLTKERTIKDLVYSKKGNAASKYVRIREHARSIAKRCKFYDKPCHNCNYSKHVEICHIKDIQEFDENTKLGIVNDPNNLVQLCPNCHWEFDNGLLSIKREILLQDPVDIKEPNPTLCKDCDRLIADGSKQCLSCYKKTVRASAKTPIRVYKKRNKTKKVPPTCIDCSTEIYYGSTRCKSCSTKLQMKNKTKRPSKEQLILDKENLKSFVQVGKKYGVSDNAVRKWFRYYGVEI